MGTAFLHYSKLDNREIDNLIQKMIETCKKKGIKVTTQRILIFKELAKHTKEHPSAEDLYNLLKDKVYGLSISTVYRALSIFESLGLVRRIPTPDGKAHFEIANEPHGHFVCHLCGKVFDLDVTSSSYKDIKENLSQKGFNLESCNLVCFGTCKDCSN